jgi:recombination protein RecA
VDPAVRAVMTKVNRRLGDGTVILGSEIRKAEVPSISSGSLSLDAALGGGWAANHWNEIIGHESTGKTFLAMKTIAHHQKIDPKWFCVWVAAEDFVDDYAEMAGLDLTRVMLIDCNQMEQVYQTVYDFMETRAVDGIVIDSLPALVPAREDEQDMDEFQPGLSAFLTGKFFRMTNPSMKRSLTEKERPITGLVVNQWREKITRYGDPRTAPGGKAKNFFYFQRVDLSRADFITNTRGDVIGQTINALVIKNKLGRPRREAVMDAYIADGKGHKAGEIDRVKDIETAALAYGVIRKIGVKKYTFADYIWANGRPQMSTQIGQDIKLRRELRRAVLKAAALPPSEREKDAVPIKKKAPVKKAPARRSA